MLGLFKKFMNGIINLVDKIKCNLGCCTNTVYVIIPRMQTDLKHKHNK